MEHINSTAVMEIIQILILFLTITGPFGLVSSTPTNPPAERHSASLDVEPIPAETDPHVAHLVELMNALEPWDHL